MALKKKHAEAEQVRAVKKLKVYRSVTTGVLRELKEVKIAYQKLKEQQASMKNQFLYQLMNSMSSFEDKTRALIKRVRTTTKVHYKDQAKEYYTKLFTETHAKKNGKAPSDNGAKQGGVQQENRSPAQRSAGGA